MLLLVNEDRKDCGTFLPARLFSSPASSVVRALSTLRFADIQVLLQNLEARHVFEYHCICDGVRICLMFSSFTVVHVTKPDDVLQIAFVLYIF